MTAAGSRLHALTLHLVTVCFWVCMLCITPSYAAPSSNDIDWLWRPMADEAEIELRITSVNPLGKRQITEILLRYKAESNTMRLYVTPREKDQPGPIFCFQCNVAGTLTSCEMKTSSLPKPIGKFIPDTLLPWHVLADRLCQQFSALKNKQYSNSRYSVFELIPLQQSNLSMEGKLLVYVSNETMQPEKMVRVNALGQELFSIDIHEIRNTIWGKVITRSTYRDLLMQTRVLIEARSGAASMPLGPERK